MRKNWRVWFSVVMLIWWAWVAFEAYSHWWVCVESEPLARDCSYSWQRQLWWGLPPLALLGLVVWLAPLWRWLSGRRFSSE